MEDKEIMMTPLTYPGESDDEEDNPKTGQPREPREAPSETPSVDSTSEPVPTSKKNY